jgi:hypothetical protein
MRSMLMAAVALFMMQVVGNAPAHADVKYLPEGPGFIEITGNDFDLWRQGNLVPRPDLPNGPCKPIIQGGCHCPNTSASGTVGSERRIVLLARKVDRCPGIASFTGPNHQITANNTWIGQLVLNISGNSFTGMSHWDCCPKGVLRHDPVLYGTINGTTIQFVRNCTDKACYQTYTGTITGPNQASGTWDDKIGSRSGTWTIP